MKCDYHVHSYYSDDSNVPMERQLKKACSLGLDELCFTDHVDYGVGGDNINYARYFSELDRMREKFSGKITVRSGLEFGVQSHRTRYYESVYNSYRENIDFILLSIHQVNDLTLWSQSYQSGKTQDEYNRGYYEELLNVVRCYHDYSVLAHLDVIVRYDMAGVYPFAKAKDIIAEILTEAINDGKGIELNTSSWRYGLTDTQPSREILKLYHDLGGEILSLGSDAHSPEYIYSHMDEATAILKGIGFRRFCTFDKMKPSFHEL
ncbi:MAG: histidinol-phosphatase HisJ family protein [Synergistaceae bacterium]|nr:histidinol-phosphatase HisJ family protein [Synergistaceae bacterium]